jgi:hypothetical protein
MSALGAFGVIEIVHRTALGASLFGQLITRDRFIGSVKLKLAAVGAKVNVRLQCSGKQIGKVA